jgi:hypothetical protein
VSAVIFQLVSWPGRRMSAQVLILGLSTGMEIIERRWSSMPGFQLALAGGDCRASEARVPALKETGSRNP